MYSSGTTGMPKCIVQGVGVLLNHMKELVLHTDLTRDDRIFYFSTTGWMMWNWLTSSLAVGASIILFDGNPLWPDSGCLWRLAEQLKMTIFGTSARYLAAIMGDGAFGCCCSCSCSCSYSCSNKHKQTNKQP
jgi:acetoacetyl-CoA synthetase